MQRRSEFFIHSFVVCLLILINLSLWYLHFHATNSGFNIKTASRSEIPGIVSNLLMRVGLHVKKEFFALCPLLYLDLYVLGDGAWTN